MVKYKNLVLSLVVSLSVMAVAVLTWRGATKDLALSDVEYTPWSSVGGCGAGGSGGGGGGVKWVGTGVSGGLIDVEVMYTATVGQNYNQKTVKTRLGIKPTYTTSMGISIPVVSKMGTLQPQTNIPPRNEITGGLSDITIDISKSVGMSGQFSLNASFTLPTGQYDIKRGEDGNQDYLPSSLQKGAGLLGTSFGIGYTKDVEGGIWMGDLTLSYPVALNLRGENELFDYTDDMLDKMSDEDRKRFDYVFKPYGENKLGAYTPPSISGSIYYGYRGVEHFVHSFGITFSVPLGVAWIPNFNADRDAQNGAYNPFPDADHKAWSGSLNYGLEFSRHKYPVFIAVSLPISDSKNEPSQDKYDDTPFKKWDAPDFGDFLQSWTVGIGVKSAMF